MSIAIFLFQKYLVLLLVLTLRYFIVAGGYYFATWVLLKKYLQAFVVNKRKPFEGQFKFEIINSLYAVFLFAVAGINFVAAKEYHIGQVYTDISERGVGYFVFSIALMLLIGDLYFYWSHRWLHTKENFAKFHYVHHKSKTTTPWTAQSFHPVETFINVLIGMLYPYLFPVHPLAYVTFALIAFLNNVYGHGNIDLVPHKLRKFVPFSWLNSPSVHGFHHESITGNYGLYTNLWDRLHGTYVDPERVSPSMKGNN